VERIDHTPEQKPRRERIEAVRVRAKQRRQHQPGRIHEWTLMQSEVWVDRFGDEHLLVEMDREYLVNVIWMLRDCATMLRSRVVDDPAASCDYAGARRWIDDTPLVNAMIDQVGHDPAWEECSPAPRDYLERKRAAASA
jgi:hypothetical protein